MRRTADARTPPSLDTSTIQLRFHVRDRKEGTLMLGCLKRHGFFSSCVTLAALLAACSGPGNVSSSPAGAFAPAQSQSKSQAQSKHTVFAVHPETNSAFIPAVHITKGTVYDSVVALTGGKVSSHISSEGFECCSTKELGDGLVFTHGANKLKRVSVVMNFMGLRERSLEYRRLSVDTGRYVPGSNHPEGLRGSESAERSGWCRRATRHPDEDV